MTPQFRLTQPAIQDIEQIADYIASRSGLDRADRPQDTAYVGSGIDVLWDLATSNGN